MITCKSLQELAVMKEAGQIVALVLHKLKSHVKPGTTTIELDQIAFEMIKENDAKPAFLGYRGYPASICTSINEEVVHGIPGKRALSEGDLLSIDVGVKYQGFYGDAAVTVPVGEVEREAENLMKVARQALSDAIEQTKVGNRLYDISAAIQRRAESHGYSVVRDFVGHGIGQRMHEDPQVPNFGEAGKGPILKEGMVFAIEPMVNQGVGDVRVLNDEWTVKTVDNKLSAHFEHTVAVTENGPQILTLH